MYDDAIVERALALSGQGLSDAEVARICGVFEGSVRHWRHQGRRSDILVDPRRACPRCSGRPLDHRAYSYLFGLYLGDGHLAHHRRGVLRLTIACGDDWPGLIDAAAAVMPTSSVGRRRQTGCTIVEIVAEFTKEFVRGLIHSDGSRSTNRIRRPGRNGDRWYEYPRYFFSTTSADVRGLFTDSLDRLGIEWKQANHRNISVAKREAVARLDEFVGPKY
jgi:hypothetical protein